MRFGSPFAGIGGFDLGLERAGMTCAWQVESDVACNRVLDAQYFGVAQRRRRVFLVGRLGDGARACRVLFEPQSCERHPAAGVEAKPEVAGALTPGPHASGFTGQDAYSGNLVNTVAHKVCATVGRNRSGNRISNSMTLIPSVVGSLTAHHGRNEESATSVTHCLSAEGHDASEDGTGRGTPLGGLQRRQHKGLKPTGNEAGTVLCLPTTVRRLTPTECERLQGFPDGWTAGESDSARYRMLGNAVCVPVAAWIARRMVEVDRGDNG